MTGGAAPGGRRAPTIAVVGAVAAVGLLAGAWTEILTGGWPAPVAIDLVLAAAITVPVAAVPFRRSAVTGAVLGAVLLQALLGPTPESIAETLALVIAVFAGALLADRGRIALLAVGVAAGAASILRSDGVTGPSDAVFDAVVLVLPALAGLLIRARLRSTAAERRRARLAVERRRTLAELAVREERARIARELHDVVAHALSIAVVQAAGGRAVLPRDPAAARTAFEVIVATGDRALGELQGLVGALRGADGPGAPVPELARLDELVASTTAAGLATTLRTSGRPLALPVAVELSAYRIVQEALTNALRYGGAGRATVEVDWADPLRVRVVNDRGSVGSPGPAGSRNGIIGMRERAALCGGRLDAAPTPDGGFAVEALLPAGAR